MRTASSRARATRRAAARSRASSGCAIGGRAHAGVAAVEDGPRCARRRRCPGSRTGPRIAAASAASGAGVRRRTGTATAAAPTSSCERVRRVGLSWRASSQAYPARMSEVAALEDVCERAWPPRERVELDGAVLRFTDGFTRRANSARVDGGGDDLDGLIARAEHEYRSRGLRPGFRLTPLSPPAFERLLGERGYVVDTEAVVMVAEALPEAAGTRRRRDRAAARARRGMAARLPGRRAPLAGRAGPGRPLGARLGRPRRAASRSRASTVRRRRPGTRAWRTTGSTSPASAPSPTTAGAGSRAPSASGSSPGARLAARGAPSCRSRRKTPRRRGFMRSSASARATSTATSCRVPSQPLTNTPSSGVSRTGRVVPMPVQQGALGGAGGTPKGLW